MKQRQTQISQIIYIKQHRWW